ncbi:MAG TPA: FAD-dependent monooxygenase, partial [Pyrinomonadaceae bacterium]|nr:FAD-dependent monooxygenase [Pyrinomonadaceae bacterium]
MPTTIKTDIIIVGAGPTGLSLACQLIRYGVDFVIVDKNQGVTPYSKALGVHARTLEIYEQLDLAQPAIERGSIAGKVRLLEGGEIRGEVDLSQVGQGLSPYPYMLVLEQSQN